MQAVMQADSFPGIDRFVTVEYRIRFDAVVQEDFLDGTLMGGCDADGPVLHTVELRLSDPENHIVLDVLGLGIRKFVEQLAHAVCIKYRRIAYIFLTLGRITDEIRIENIHYALVGRKETGCLMAQAGRGFRAFSPEAMYEMERHLVVV